MFSPVPTVIIDLSTAAGDHWARGKSRSGPLPHAARCMRLLAFLAFVFSLSLVSGTARCAQLKGVAGDPMAIRAVSRQVPEMVYYVYDWGDGTWTPSGRVNGDAGMSMEHIWNAPGEYPAQWIAMSLSGRGSLWHPAPVAISGTARAPRMEFLPVKTVTAGSKLINSTDPEKSAQLADCLNWQSPGFDSPFVRNWLSLEFYGPQSVGWVVLTQHASEPFPEFFCIEYSLDGGQRWHPVMSAVYSFFPSPGKNAVRIPLNGVVADAIRITTPRASRFSNGKFGSALGNFQAVAGPPPPFGSSSNATKIGLWNNLWTNYGVAANEVLARNSPWWQTDRPLDGGTLGIPSCEWLFWDANKITWLPGSRELDALKKYLSSNPVEADGYVWPSKGSDKHLNHSRHTVTNAIYPMAVAKFYLQTRDRSFFDELDPKTSETVLAKARRAMDYQIQTLGGKSGLLTVSDPDIDGTPASKGNNYWDFWLFGGQSAYDNAFFYESLRWMAALEEALGNEADAKTLRDLRPLVKRRFNETFWDGKKGRYIGWIASDGQAHDYGFPFVNLTAIAWGLADKERAADIFEWLDGKRIIEGETSTGKDIYAFRFAPRSNTIDAASGNPRMVNTWNGGLDVEPGGNAAFGLQIQNGGAIFYVSFYDLMARLRARGMADAMGRMDDILAEAAIDEIRRDPANMRGHSDIVGILREFPESGLVPLFFLDGVLGLESVAKGLRIHPSLPPGWKDAVVRDYAFAGNKLLIIADEGLKAPTISRTEGLQTIQVPANGDWLLTMDGKIEPWKEPQE